MCATLIVLLLCVVTGIVLTVKIFGDGHTHALVLRVGTGFVVVGVSFVFLMFSPFFPPKESFFWILRAWFDFSEGTMGKNWRVY